MIRNIGKAGDKATARDRITAHLNYLTIRPYPLKHVCGTILHMADAFLDMLISTAWPAQAAFSIKADNISYWPAYPHHGFRVVKHLQIGAVPSDQLQFPIDYTYALA